MSQNGPFDVNISDRNVETWSVAKKNKKKRDMHHVLSFTNVPDFFFIPLAKKKKRLVINERD